MINVKIFFHAWNLRKLKKNVSLRFLSLFYFYKVKCQSQNSFFQHTRYSSCAFSHAHILTSSCFWASLTALTRCSVVVALAVAIRFWMVLIYVWNLISSWSLMSQRFFHLFLCFNSSFLIFFLLRNFCQLA